MIRTRLAAAAVAAAVTLAGCDYVAVRSEHSFKAHLCVPDVSVGLWCFVPVAVYPTTGMADVELPPPPQYPTVGGA